MPHTVIFPAKIIILSRPITILAGYLESALMESGLVSQDNINKEGSKPEEFTGDEKVVRKGIFNSLFAGIENRTDSNWSAHQKKQREEEYELDPPAFELQQRYENYLNDIFQNRANSQNSSQKSDDDITSVINDKYVYVREMLLRLFTAAISVNKNATSEADKAPKLINCMRSFCQKINSSEILFEKTIPLPLVGTKETSEINDAFSKEHLQWIYLLQNMQTAIAIIHSHTATLTTALNTFERLRKGIILHLIMYMSSKDIDNKDLSVEWLKVTLANIEKSILPAENDSQSLVKILDEFASDTIAPYQKNIVATLAKSEHKKNTAKVERLYLMLARTNLLLRLLQRFDMLFTTTGWTLIVSDAINFKIINKMLEEHKEVYTREVIEDRLDLSDKPGMKIARTRFLTNNSVLSVERTFDQITDGLSAISSPTIKNCIIQTIGKNLNDLKDIGDRLNCQLIYEDKLSIMQASVNYSASSAATAPNSNLLGRDSPLKVAGNNNARATQSLPRKPVVKRDYTQADIEQFVSVMQAEIVKFKK